MPRLAKTGNHMIDYLFMTTQIIILAAGAGKRMESDLPIALTPLHGKPFISYVLKSVADSGVCDNPIIVIGQKREQIIGVLGNDRPYAIQEEQLGTGHAVMMAEKLAQNAQVIVILYADQPLISSETIRALVAKQKETGSVLTMATTRVPDFTDWRAGFMNFSRIIRNDAGEIIRVVEAKDASDIEKKILEVNPCYFCFDALWMWQHLQSLKNNNAQKEYYLTDLVGMACAENKPIASIEIEPKEALGVNTKEQLRMMEAIA